MRAWDWWENEIADASRLNEILYGGSGNGIDGRVEWFEFNQLIRIQVVFVVFCFSSNSGRRIADSILKRSFDFGHTSLHE